MDEGARIRPRLPAKLLVGGGVLLALLAIALFAPLLAPHDPLEQDLMSATLPPLGWPDADPAHWLGTDDLGRDVLSRLIYGTRIALTVAVLAAAGAAAIGSALGLLAGFFGGWLDAAVSRLVEIWMAFPAVLLSILIVALIGSGVTSVVVAIAVIDWTRFARVVRADTMAQARQDYVVAARTVGYGRAAILWREILPNVLPTLIGLLALEMGIAVVVEAILSFVGLSVSSDAPTWGGMIASGRQIIHQAWWVFAAPLAMLFVDRAGLQPGRRRPARGASIRCCGDDGPAARRREPDRGRNPRRPGADPAGASP